jgi:8-oxo-dGTP pyrophosphatase MutT (NUDIX family)
MPSGARPALGDRSPRTPAAVLVPVFRDPADELRVVLVVRGSGGIHGGQIGLPGGKVEPGDRSLLETALREAEEETGLAGADVEVLAALDPIDTHTSGFRVHPFLARVRIPRVWRVAEGEIVEVVCPGAAMFADPRERRTVELTLPHWPRARPVDGVVLEGGQLVWGFTFRLLDGLVPRLLAGEWAV